MDLQMQLEKVNPIHGLELGPDCLCPPVCFQCPPPFCLPCGPGPGGALPDTAADAMPAPRQCGPFLMLNTPMERNIIMLPMMSSLNEGGGNKAETRGTKNGGRRQGRNDRRVECCEEEHHHHHRYPSEDECCDEKHHHHHHDDEECGEKRPKGGRGRRRRSSSDDEESLPETPHKSTRDDSSRKSRSEKRDAGGSNARTNSRELRGGKLMTGCECEKRNGLQDECPRSMCMGSPECVTNPPTCPPSRFSGGKHLTKLREAQEKKIREAFKYC